MLLVIAGGHARAQTTGATQGSVRKSPGKLIEATNQYKSTSQALLVLQESEVRSASSRLAELRLLVAQGVVARTELETSEQALAALQAQLAATQKQLIDADNMIAGIKADEALAQSPIVKLVSKQYVGFANSGAILRYSGRTSWSLGGLGGVQGFYVAKFGHSLPTSAVGQSATHNRLGYDHRNAVDVALHPDSLEGRALINYLQIQGIPFLAFRGAIAGVATGPHIHIGSASHRLS